MSTRSVRDMNPTALVAFQGPFIELIVRLRSVLSSRHRPFTARIWTGTPIDRSGILSIINLGTSHCPDSLFAAGLVTDSLQLCTPSGSLGKPRHWDENLSRFALCLQGILTLGPCLAGRHPIARLPGGGDAIRPTGRCEPALVRAGV